jgi:hypothetical protein
MGKNGCKNGYMMTGNLLVYEPMTLRQQTVADRGTRTQYCTVDPFGNTDSRILKINIASISKTQMSSDIKRHSSKFSSGSNRLALNPTGGSFANEASLTHGCQSTHANQMTYTMIPINLIM